jgi:hypothetical protein
MSQLVTVTLQRIFGRKVSAHGRSRQLGSARRRDTRSKQPDFVDTRPVVFRSGDAYAEDFAALHGAI